MDHSLKTLRLGTSDADLQRAGAILCAGGLVAMPTETVYGLAANALDEAAVQSVFVAKQRPRWDPLIVHIADGAMLPEVAEELSPTAKALAEASWPGPLTMLLRRNPALPLAVTAGRGRVGVRMPAHPVALQLIRAAGVPLAAPSANRFGRISPTCAAHVLADLDGRIDAVIDAGASAIGVESTVLDPDTDPITIYRHGGVSAADVLRVTGREVITYAAAHERAPESLPSPGVGMRHYAPEATLLLIASETELNAVVSELEGKVGALLPSPWQLTQPVYATYRWGEWNDPAELARRLYDGLRTLDEAGVRWIVCPMPAAGDGDLREALRDRLRKAAMPRTGTTGQPGTA